MAVLDSDRVIAALRGSLPGNKDARCYSHRCRQDPRRRSAVTSVYLYMLHGQELVLEAYAGRETEHTRIPVGVGVCGTAVASGQDQNVPDVRAVGTISPATCGPAPSWWC